MVIAIEPRTRSLTADYDRDADVLYVAVGQPRPGYGDDGPDDVILRYGKADRRPSGVTVVGFQENGWPRRLRDLAAIIARHVDVNECDAWQIVGSATA